MNRPTIGNIHEVMKAAGMQVFETPYSMTLGWIRTQDNESNKFNDWIFASMPTQNGGIWSTVFEGNTDAGLYYRLTPINVDGTAIIQHGHQFGGAFQYQHPGENDRQRGHKGQEAFRQIKDILYWRDADRDKYLEFDGETLSGNFATNGHDMGESGAGVGRWSAGCWGAVTTNMDILYLMARTQIKNGLGDKFSLATLHESMF